MKRSVFLRSMVFCLALTLLFPMSPLVSPALADSPFSSPDSDGDGLSNEMETNGWYNLAGGPYVTDPLDADTDNDGLADGEEKLYNTNPLDDKDPGFYVKYQDDLKTREYFRTTDPAYLSEMQGGDRYLMTEAMVVRRGATFHIGGPSGANLTITGPGLTPLTPAKDPCAGGWTVRIPSDGTVGTYTATVSLGGWNKSMPLYVIFELPMPSPSSAPLYNLSQASIATFLYDDDSSNLRDERSVWFYAPEDRFYRRCSPPDNNSPPCSDWAYHWTKGYAQGFTTDQFKKYVFLNHAMPAINGYTAQTEATNAVAAWADKEFRVNYNYVDDTFADAMYTWFDGTGITMYGGACQDNANIFTTMLRSAGIAARTFLIDYNKTPGHDESGQIGTIYEYDHSVLMWLDGHWKVGRSYATGEMDDKYYPWDHGYRSHREITNYYLDQRGDLIISANEGWDWAMVNTDYPSWHDPATAGRWDYYWYSNKPLEIIRSPYVDILNYETWHGDNWAPSEWRDPLTDPTYASNPPGLVATQTYYLPPGIPAYVGDLENWPYNPVPIGCSPSTPSDVCAAFLAGMGSLGLQSNTLPETPPTSLPPAVSAWGLESSQAGPIKLGAVTGDYGVDLDGNGRFDKLVIKVEVNVAKAGSYTFGGGLLVGPHTIYADENRLYLDTGVQTVEISFDGKVIGLKEVNGPYRVTDVWVTDVKSIQPGETEPLDRQDPAYSTAPYAAGEFETTSALFAANFRHQGLDNDGDGYYEALAIQVPLRISVPGTYRVEGDLYDGDGNFVGHATWTGIDPTAILRFEVTETRAPYKVENLILLDPKGALLDSKRIKAYEIADVAGMIDRGALSIDNGMSAAGGISGMAVIPTNVFTTTAVDTNGNGRYDKLVIKTRVTVTDAGGAYRIEGLLVDGYGTPVAWSVSNPQTLGVGDQEMELTFDGRMLHDHMPLSPATQSFKLVAVKVFSGNLSPATLEDEVAVATTTPAYTRDDFEPASTTPAIFGDDMESGTSHWTWGSPWSLSDSVWRSPSHAWRANASGSQSGSLNTISLSLSNYVDPALRLRTCYAMRSSGDIGYLEASANGGAWTRVATYTNSTSYWTTGLVDLSNFNNAPNLRLRFRANSQSGVLWYVDDVALNAWLDDDGDGLSNVNEIALGTNPNNPDTDGDGLTDGQEVDVYGTDPKDSDSDNDGLPDGWEVDHDLNPLANDAAGDPDNDGLTNLGEYQNGTDPHNADSDDDGLTDGAEVNTHHTNPNDADSDNDGLTDGAEVNTHHTNPNDADSDDDGMPDGWEVENGLNPLVNDALDDPDGDGLTNVEEYQYGSDPHNPDTDGDGIPDGEDPSPAGIISVYLPVILK